MELLNADDNGGGGGGGGEKKVEAFEKRIFVE